MSGQFGFWGWFGYHGTANGVIRIIKTVIGYLTDENGDYFVDENGDKFTG